MNAHITSLVFLLKTYADKLIAYKYLISMAVLFGDVVHVVILYV